MPFGTGPHNCIGERFAQLNNKIGLINFFRDHQIRPSEGTPRKIVLEKKAFIIQSEGGIHLNILRNTVI